MAHPQKSDLSLHNLVNTQTAGFAVTNTLALTSNAELGMKVCTLIDLAEALRLCREKNCRWLPLGSGSNIVPLSSVHGFVGEIDIKGIDVIQETKNSALVRVGAGEEWHQWVNHAITRGWYGLENLTLIPGKVGAAPIQNIGAYGVEVADFVEQVECMTLDGETTLMSASRCDFDYRTSVFKTRPDLTVTAVVFRLPKQPNLKTSYPGVSEGLAKLGLIEPQPIDIAAIIQQIRRSKLPDPHHTANAGSFFKNPLVQTAQASLIKQKLPDLQQFASKQFASTSNSTTLVKLSAAQLIDSLGWKERGEELVGCWPNQPLVLVNKGLERGEDLLAFAAQIQRDVVDNYDVELELEPSVLS